MSGLPDRPPGAGTRLLRALGVDVRAGEAATALLLTAGIFLVTTFQVATKAVRQSTFIDALGAANLPVVYLLVALLSYPALRLYNRAAARTRIERLFSGTILGVALFLVLFWGLYRLPTAWVPFAFYIGSSIVYAILITQFWTYATGLLDARQARRLFGPIGAGGLLGGIAGGQTARVAAGLSDTSGVLLVSAVLLLVAAATVRSIPAAQAPAEGRGRRGAGLELKPARGGVEALRSSPQLRWIAALMGLSVVVAQVVDLQFNWVIEQVTTSLEQRTAYFGNFFSVLGLSAFVFQLLLTTRIHRVLGVGFAMRVLPVSMVVGSVALLVSVGFLPALLVGLALAVKLTENGLRFSLDQVTRELLFLPVPAALRVQGKAFIDVFVQRGAKGLAALLLLPVTFGAVGAIQMSWVTLAAALLWTALAGMAFREYLRTFRHGLERRAVDTTIPINLSDSATLELVMQSLSSSDRRQVLHSLDLLNSQDRGALVPPLLLYHDDSEIRRKTLAVLAAAGRVDALPLIERRLGDDDPDVRAEAIRVLADLRGGNICELMLPRMREGDAGVRAAAVACLSSYGDESMVAEAGRVLEDLLTDADPGVRVEAARALGAIPDPKFQERLVHLLYDPEPQVVREAIAAVKRRGARDGYNPLYVATLVSLLQKRRVKHEARAALTAFGEPVVGVLAHFLTSPEEPVWVRRALPKTLARLHSRSAARSLLHSLDRVTDHFTRRKVVEALTDCRQHVTGDGDDGPAIERQVGEEAKHYLLNLARLAGLGALPRMRFAGPRILWHEEDDPSLLERLLGERADDHLWNIFGLLALIHDPEPMWAAYYGMVGPRPLARAHALEYVDNLLTGEARRVAMAAVDDAAVEEKLRRAERMFGVRTATRLETLAALLSERDDDDAHGLRTGAIYAVHAERVTELYPQIERLAREAREPMIRETAAWAEQRFAPSR